MQSTDSDAVCGACGYSLRTLGSGAACPECGSTKREAPRLPTPQLLPVSARLVPCAWLAIPAVLFACAVALVYAAWLRSGWLLALCSLPLVLAGSADWRLDRQSAAGLRRFVQVQRLLLISWLPLWLFALDSAIQEAIGVTDHWYQSMVQPVIPPGVRSMVPVIYLAVAAGQINLHGLILSRILRGAGAPPFPRRAVAATAFVSAALMLAAAGSFAGLALVEISVPYHKGGERLERVWLSLMTIFSLLAAIAAMLTIPLQALIFTSNYPQTEQPPLTASPGAPPRQESPAGPWSAGPGGS